MRLQTNTHIQTTVLILTILVFAFSTSTFAQGITDPSFGTGGDTSTNGAIEAITGQSDGKILVGGQFSQIGGHSQNSIARLNTDGTVDTSFTASFALNDTVYAIAV